MVTREGLSGPSYVKAANKDLNEDLFGPNFQADIQAACAHARLDSEAAEPQPHRGRSASQRDSDDEESDTEALGQGTPRRGEQ